MRIQSLPDSNYMSTVLLATHFFKVGQKTLRLVSIYSFTIVLSSTPDVEPFAELSTFIWSEYAEFPTTQEQALGDDAAPNIPKVSKVQLTFHVHPL